MKISLTNMAKYVLKNSLPLPEQYGIYVVIDPVTAPEGMRVGDTVRYRLPPRFETVEEQIQRLVDAMLQCNGKSV